MDNVAINASTRKLPSSISSSTLGKFKPLRRDSPFENSSVDMNAGTSSFNTLLGKAGTIVDTSDSLIRDVEAQCSIQGIAGRAGTSAAVLSDVEVRGAKVPVNFTAEGDLIRGVSSILLITCPLGLTHYGVI